MILLLLLILIRSNFLCHNRLRLSELISHMWCISRIGKVSAITSKLRLNNGHLLRGFFKKRRLELIFHQSCVLVLGPKIVCCLKRRWLLFNKSMLCKLLAKFFQEKTLFISTVIAAVNNCIEPMVRSRYVKTCDTTRINFIVCITVVLVVGFCYHLQNLIRQIITLRFHFI